MNSYIFIGCMVISVLIASCSQILLKKSANIEYSNKLKEYMNVYVIVGYGMMVVSILLTIYAYTGLEYKNGPIIESLGYIFIMVLSWMVFKEKITIKKLLGNMLILVGIAIYYM